MVEILWRDGFDHYNNTTDLETVYAEVLGVVSFGAGRTDGKCISIYYSSISNATLRFQNLAPQSDLTVAVAANPTNGGSGPTAPVIAMKDISSSDVLLTADFTTPNLVECTTQNGTVYSGSIPLIPNGNWTHIQVRLIVGVAGSIEILFNGSTQVFLQTNIDTRGSAGAITSVNSVSLYAENLKCCSFDDLIICTGGFIGDCRIQTDFPVSDQSVQMTPLSGTSNFAMVDEIAMDSDTSYVYAAASGLTDLYGFTPLSLPAGSTVLDVSLVSAVRKTDAGTRAYTQNVSQGGTLASGTSFTPSTSYQYVVDTFATDPTGAAWTEANINSAYYGGECSA